MNGVDDDSFFAELDRITPETPSGGQTHSTSNESYVDLIGAEDLLDQMEQMLSSTDGSSTETAPLTSTPHAAVGLKAVNDNFTFADDEETTARQFTSTLSVSRLKSNESKKSFRWRDDDNRDSETTSAGSLSLEDVRSFNKEQPASQVGSVDGHEGSSSGDSFSDEEEIDPVLERRAKGLMKWLYISHALSAWGDRMWEFAVVLLMIQIWPNTLLLSALFGLVVAATKVFAGSLVGEWVDHTNRLHVVRVSLIIGNGSIVLAAILIIALLQPGARDDGSFWFLISLLLILGATTSLGSLGSNLAVEKEWVKILCAGNSHMLSKTNAFMRRIDLICKLVAPIFVGIIMATSGGLAGSILIGCWNLLSMVPEYVVLTWTYRAIPQLQEDKSPSDTSEMQGVLARVLGIFVSLKKGWGTYSSLETFRPALALGLLYCTVLSFGSIMTAYAYTRGVNEAHLAVARGVGAMFGLIGTFLFPKLSKKYGISKTGLGSIYFQLSMLALCIASTAFSSDSGDCEGVDDETHNSCTRNRDIEMGLLITGVVTSRLGLWMFDLSVTQMLQERVGSDMIGIVNGTQASIQNLLDLLGYVLGLIMNKPSQFDLLAWISFAFVLAAALLYTTFWHVDKHRPKKKRKPRGPGSVRLIDNEEEDSAFTIEDDDDDDDDDDKRLDFDIKEAMDDEPLLNSTAFDAYNHQESSSI